MKDLKDIEIQRLLAEVVRLNNELAQSRNYVRFLEEENKSIEEEVRQECKNAYELKLATVIGERDEAIARAESAESKLEMLEGVKEVADEAQKVNMDYRSIIRMIQQRTFNHNSDATRFLNGEIDPNDPRVQDMGFEDIFRHVNGLSNQADDIKHSVANKAKNVTLPKKTNNEQPRKGFSPRKKVWTTTELRREGIDTTGMSSNTKIVKRKGTKDGLDKWIVRTLTYEKPKVTLTEYEVARIYIPGQGMDCTNRPKTIIEGNPVMPSFARFYLDGKFALNLSENRILQMLESMQTKIPQSTLNNWMHQIMELLRQRLQHLMTESIKRSLFTHNDETRILVRSRADKNAPFKYNMEYIHAALSLEKKLVVMLYKDGSRDHGIQEESFFRDSDIKCFLADRAPLYQTIERDLEEYHIMRAACWFHFRHYMVDAYISDSRVYDIIEYVNFLFYVEKESAKRNHTHEQRQRFRLKYSQPIVSKILKRLEEIRLAGKEYGDLVHRAVNYLLDDKKAFLKFLQEGQVELSNNAIERCFRHIAIGRRNWLHSGSHFAAENIAFMYSLLESCKLNKINFGEYIEDVLTRIMNGEDADESFLPNHYNARQQDGQKVA